MRFFDNEFKRTATKIGAVLLIFLALFGVLSFMSALANDLMGTLTSSPTVRAIMTVVRGAAYFLTFTIPAIIFKMMSGKKVSRPVRSVAKLPKSTPLVIIASISIILSTAFVNSMLVSAFGFSEFMQSATEPTGRMSAFEIIATGIAMAVVPAICEEILFRGTVLSALLPYGRSFAIISSALLFGLMHQNPAQLFYATMAGIVLGYVYTKTGSIWCGVLVHFFNNLVSVIQTAALANLSQPLAEKLIVLIQLAAIGLGALSLIILIRLERNKKDMYATGSFELILEDAPEYRERQITSSPYKKLFLCPTVLIFSILTVSELIALTIMVLTGATL